MSDDFKRFQTHFGSGNLGKQKEQNWSRKMQDPLKEDNKKNLCFLFPKNEVI